MGLFPCKRNEIHAEFLFPNVFFQGHFDDSSKNKRTVSFETERGIFNTNETNNDCSFTLWE